MANPISQKSFALGLVGAVIGGSLGHFAFQMILRQGFHAIMIPPGLLGFGAGYLAGQRSQGLAIVCAIAGFALAIFTEWRFFPFRADDGFLYFVSHLHQLKPTILALMALGAFLCYRLALGVDQKSDALQ